MAWDNIVNYCGCFGDNDSVGHSEALLDDRVIYTSAFSPSLALLWLSTASLVPNEQSKLSQKDVYRAVQFTCRFLFENFLLGAHEYLDFPLLLCQKA